ncbi:VPLPA-CTERM sorting domain-containing protein [Marimonas arenosa]|uniref:VPLPA-CTERM sorting domain-containing protein n=1 Tax=Marimonas arenosa TaxID=1795305 RepID=A0AAE3WDG2_9RHOB|nr:VPLPA-CTERM sorting domain-containing protein [Marimonas arenosa]MDQ2089650.1 VPLPA-CTERM sorting domain-containing protein [Marimonas arenosa]
MGAIRAIFFVGGSTMKTPRLLGAIAAVAFTALSSNAIAATVSLNSNIQCSEGNANTISVGDVTGNNGGADDCWGAYDGNDPGPGGAFELDGVEYTFLTKYEFDNGTGVTEGADIGLTWTQGTSGTWTITSAIGQDFLIVLKASSTPGYGVWSFFGDPNNTSTSGTFDVAWNKDLSHLAIYVAPIPIPAAGLMLIGALGGLGFVARRKRRAA